MKINSIDNTKFGMEFKLSGRTLDSISKSTGLSKEELFKLSLDDASKLMKERGTIKEPSRLKQWFAEKYKQFGERTGLLEKQVNFYTDID